MIELTKLSKTELNEYLLFLSKEKLTRKYKLNNIPTDYTFGIEIEFANAPLEKIEQAIKNYNNKFVSYTSNDYFNNWEVIEDTTVTEITLYENLGGEIVSPKLNNSFETFEQIEDVCNILNDNNAIINSKCAGHIHIGAHVFKTAKQLLNFLKLWLIYEPIIYQFSTGEFSNIRNLASAFAKPLQSKLNVQAVLNLENKSMIECIKKIHPLYM